MQRKKHHLTCPALLPTLLPMPVCSVRFSWQPARRCLLIAACLLAALYGDSSAKGETQLKPFEPYFLSLRFNETYMRSGPGRQYPALWVYRRLGMPIEIIGHFDDWRKVRDFQGDIGWMLSNQLQRRRAVIVLLPEVGLYKDPDTSSVKIARLGKDVVARVQRCDHEWCRLLIDRHEGWTRRGGLWGLAEEETLP